MTYNNNKTKTLNEFQEKKIIERMRMDFIQELNSLTEKKKNFSNLFLDQMESLVNKFDNQGILFFSINIEFKFSLNEKDIWEKVHRDIEEYISYIGSHIELVEFCYFVIELKDINPTWQLCSKSIKNKKFFPRIKGIIGVRSMLGKNKLLICEIKDIFFISSYDIKIKWLQRCSEIIKYWTSITKQKNFKFHRFVNYSEFNSMIYGIIADEELKFDGRVAFGQENHFISDTMDINGIKCKFPKTKDLVFFFLKLYMSHKKMKVFKSSIFIKLDSFKVTWQFISNLESLKNNFENILKTLQILYPQQLSNFRIENITLSDLDFIFKKIRLTNSLLDEITFFDNIVEFKDGIFFFETEKFLFFRDITNLEKMKTNYSVDCNYHDYDSSKFCLKMIRQNNIKND